MRIGYLLSLSLAVIAFAAQAEPMRLTAPQMNNITGGGVTVSVDASGTETSYSSGASFSKEPAEDISITVSCCGADSTSINVEVTPPTTNVDPIHISH